MASRGTLDVETTGPLALILVAGGSGTRYQQADASFSPPTQSNNGDKGNYRNEASSNKLLTEIDGMPVFAYALKAFLHLPALRHIVLVHPPQKKSLYAQTLERTLSHHLRKDSLTLHFTPGGTKRFHSVDRGLSVLSLSGVRDGAVMIHDAARPLIHKEDMTALLQAFRAGAKTQLGVLPGMPVRDTIKEISLDMPSTQAGEIGEILCSHPRRDTLRAVSTPQIFPLAPFTASFAQFMKRNNSTETDQEAYEPTDDSEIYMAAGHPVHIVPLKHPNPKITYPRDKQEIELLLKDSAQTSL